MPPFTFPVVPTLLALSTAFSQVCKVEMEKWDDKYKLRTYDINVDWQSLGFTTISDNFYMIPQSHMPWSEFPDRCDALCNMASECKGWKIHQKFEKDGDWHCCHLVSDCVIGVTNKYDDDWTRSCCGLLGNTKSPTPTPTVPTPRPTVPRPTSPPTGHPSRAPTDHPSRAPTPKPTGHPSRPPSPAPTGRPTRPPSLAPSPPPSPKPTQAPTTDRPTAMPTPEPTIDECAPTVAVVKDEHYCGYFSFVAQADSAEECAEVVLQSCPINKAYFNYREANGACHCITVAGDCSASYVYKADVDVLRITHEGCGAPSFNPTRKPTRDPTTRPTGFPSSIPTSLPTPVPSAVPTHLPTRPPTGAPTHMPSLGGDTSSPSRAPTTATPSVGPTRPPTAVPTTPAPVDPPTRRPTVVGDTRHPTEPGFSAPPTRRPTVGTPPTRRPTVVGDTRHPTEPGFSAPPTRRPTFAGDTRHPTEPGFSGPPTRRPTFAGETMFPTPSPVNDTQPVLEAPTIAEDEEGSSVPWYWILPMLLLLFCIPLFIYWAFCRARKAVERSVGSLLMNTMDHGGYGAVNQVELETNSMAQEIAPAPELPVISLPAVPPDEATALQAKLVQIPTLPEPQLKVEPAFKWRVDTDRSTNRSPALTSNLP